MKRSKSTANDGCSGVKRSRVTCSESSQDLSLSQSQTSKLSIGTIESVQLKNFMCHSKLDFSFADHTNFIIGKNGSGKSAILTSLIIGLGGKANTASRGTNVKNLVETGKRFAEVTVRLKNVGRDAYKPEEYGDSIIIQRRLSVDGASTYRLRSERGAVVSTKREELLHILDQFNIQINNPVMILNQETSRNFLQSKSAKDKYLFFMKATQLEKLKQDYCRIEEERSLTAIEVTRKEKLLPGVEKEVKRLERHWRVLQSLEGQRQKIERLKGELLWARVMEEEESMKGTEAALQKEVRMVEKVKAKISDLQTRMQLHMDLQTGLQAELNEAMNRYEEAQPSVTAEKKQYVAIREKLRDCEKTISRVDREIREKKKESQVLQDRIQELRSMDQSFYANEKAKREAEIHEMEQKRSDLASRLRTSEHHYEQLKGAESECSAQLHHLRNEQLELKEQRTQISNTIQNLQASKKNHLQKFGRHIPQLARELQEAVRRGSFRKPPKGPLGALLQLKDERWALATESCLRGLPYSYLVDNDQDAKVLRQIMGKVMGQERKPSIIISSFMGRVYNYHAGALRSSKFVSVLENLDIADPDVINCLIDQVWIAALNYLSCLHNVWLTQKLVNPPKFRRSQKERRNT